MATILVSGNYVTGAGQVLTFTADSGTPVYTLDGYGEYLSQTGPVPLSDPNFTDQGSIQINSSAANASVVALSDNGYESYRGSRINVIAGASLAVTATGAGSSASAYQTAGSPGAASFLNYGTVTVSAAQSARGMDIGPGGGAGFFSNHGVFLVSAADAAGVEGGVGSFQNWGTLTVTGTSSAVGMHSVGAVENHGDFTVTATLGPSYAINLSNAGLRGYSITARSRRNMRSTPITRRSGSTITAQ